MIKKSLVGATAHRRAAGGPVDIQAPTAPVLSVGSVTSNSIVVNWTASTDNVGVTGYEVYVNAALVVTVATLTYTITGLIASTNYAIYVRARDAANNGTYSNTVNQSTAAAGALPLLEGYGALVTGHAASPSFTTYTVTNTNASGSGSLANGIASNRRIIFSVSGTITVGKIEIFNTSNLTIDGSTSPYPGITITATSGGTSAGLSIGDGCNNIRIHSLSFVNCRPDADGLNVVDSAQNVAVTHCFAAGNGDGNIDFASDAHHCTMQYCLIGNHEQIDNNVGGTLVTGNRVSIHHNLFFPKSPNPGDGERFPFTHRNYGVAAPGSEPDCDARWNLVYKYGRSNGTGSGYGFGAGYGAKGNAIGNYLYTVGTSANAGVTYDPDLNDQAYGRVYALGNVSGNGINLNTLTYPHANQSTPYVVPAQYAVADESSACAAAAKVLQFCGPLQRNPADGKRAPIQQAYIDAIALPLPGC